MVPLAPIYLRRAVELLQENYPRQRVWQRDRSERGYGVRPFEHFRREPQGSAEDESDVAMARNAQAVQPLGQFLRGERLALLPIQRDHIRSCRHSSEKLGSFGSKHLIRRTPVQVVLRNLDELRGEEAP